MSTFGFRTSNKPFRVGATMVCFALGKIASGLPANEFTQVDLTWFTACFNRPLRRKATRLGAASVVPFLEAMVGEDFERMSVICLKFGAKMATDHSGAPLNNRLIPTTGFIGRVTFRRNPTEVTFDVPYQTQTTNSTTEPQHSGIRAPTFSESEHNRQVVN